MSDEGQIITLEAIRDGRLEQTGHGRIFLPEGGEKVSPSYFQVQYEKADATGYCPIILTPAGEAELARLTGKKSTSIWSNR